MRYRRISSFTALTTLIFTLSLPPADFPGLFPASQVLAQTPELRKAEAVRLSEQGIEQFPANQFDAAFQSWHQALGRVFKLQPQPNTGDRAHGCIICSKQLNIG